MSTQDPHCVFVTSNRAAAELIVSWLEQQGIAAHLQTHMKESDGVMLAPLTDSDSTSHLEVHVTDSEQAERVRDLILQEQESLLQEAQRIDRAPQEDMLVTCEACGKSSLYDGSLQGTVQECQHCGAYLDVPGGADEFDWSVVDETVAEDDLPEEAEDEEESWG